MARPRNPAARSRLLEAAEDVFIDRGLDRAKVEDITTLAGLSKGAFYLHFKSKEAAFREILSGALGTIGQNLEALSATRDQWDTMSLDQVIEFWFEHDLGLFEYIWQRRTLMRLLLDGGGSPDYLHLMNLFVEQAESIVSAFIGHGVDHGYFHDDYNPELAAAFIAGGWDRVARRLVLEEERPDLELWIAQAQNFCLRAMGSPALIESATRFFFKVRAGSPSGALQLTLDSGGRTLPHFRLPPKAHKP